MHNREKLVFGLAVGLGAFAPISYAEVLTGENGIKACAKALIASIKSDTVTTPEYVVNAEGNRLEDRLHRHEVIYLDATVGKDKILAKANCRVNGDAEVKDLEILPNDAPNARRRAS